MCETIAVEREEHLTWLTLNRPEPAAYREA